MKRHKPLTRRTPLRSDPLKQRAFQRRGAVRWHQKRKRTAKERELWQERVIAQAEATNFHCQVHGLHDRTCPGFVSLPEGHGHHVHPREHGGTDQSSPVLWCWPACHARLHNHPREAIALGFLRRHADG